MPNPLIYGARLALPALRGIGQGLLAGIKNPGAIIGQKAFEYGLVLPALGGAANLLGIPFGYRPNSSQPAVAFGPNAGLTPQQFDRLYGSPNWSIGPFQLPFGGQKGYLEEQAQQQRELQRDLAGIMADTQRQGFRTQEQIARFSTDAQRQGYRTQEQIARLNTDTQRSLGLAGYRTQEQIARLNADLQRSLGFAGYKTQYGIADLGSRRQLAGLYGGYRRDVAIADRNLAGLYDTNRTHSRIASIQGNVAKYKADRDIEGIRLNAIAPRLAVIGNIFSRRY